MLPFIFLLALHGYIDAKRIVVRKYSAYFENLPSQFDGYSILHLSDFHFTRYSKWVDIIAEYIRNLPADIAVITGDFRYKKYTDSRGALESMERLAPAFRVRDGIYACLGNKDTVAMIPDLEKLRIKVLRNSNIRIRRNGGEMYLLGVDERNPYKDFSTDAADSLRGIPDGTFRILLAHTPDYIKWSRLFAVDLVLAGDTHGGQIRFPLIGPVAVKSRISRRYCRGWIYENRARMFINSGLGSVGLPIRTFCPPEIVQIVLRRGTI